MTGHDPTAPRPRGFTPSGFTLVEIILVLTLGLAMAAMLVVTTGDMYTKSPLTLHDLDVQYDLLQEMEDLTSEYRSRIDAGTLNLSSLLSGWTTTSSDVTVAYEAVSVTDSGASYTMGTNVYKVTMTDGEHSVSAYFTE